METHPKHLPTPTPQPDRGPISPSDKGCGAEGLAHGKHGVGRRGGEGVRGELVERAPLALVHRVHQGEVPTWSGLGPGLANHPNQVCMRAR